MQDKIIWFFNKESSHELYNFSSFVDEKLKRGVTDLKNQLNQIPQKDIHSARIRYDGYYIRGLPRGVIKMANLDYMFKVIKNIKTFGDLCGGPGGFVEFILFKNSTCVGYGMTLNNSKDNYYVSSPRFTAIYGPGGDGDIFNEDNVSKFPIDLDFVIADGGLNVKGNENDQETIHINLYLAQIGCALRCVNIGGTFIIKFFDTHTKASVNLLYILSTCFKQICIYKPVSSRAANSERYVICINRVVDVLPQTHIIKHCLLNLNETDNIKISQPFYNYVCERNNSIAKIQLRGLRRLISFVKHPHLKSTPIFRQLWHLDKLLFVNRNIHHGIHNNGDRNIYKNFTTKRAR